MRYVEISGLGSPVSNIGLGTTSRSFTTEPEPAPDLLEAFLGAGGNLVDTAHIYGFGTSEQTLGRWFEESGRRDEVILLTKGCHPTVDPDDFFGTPWVSRVTPDAIRADLSESLERLRTNHVDIYLLHRDDETVDPGPLIEALNEEQERGRIKVFGASNWSVRRIVEANEFAARNGLNGFVVSSPGMSLARPTTIRYPGCLFADDAMRHWHESSRLPLLAFSSLSAGFINRSPSSSPTDDDAGPYYSDENFERLRRAQEIAKAKNATGLQVALAFVLLQPFPVIGAIGPSSVSHLESALGALDVELTAEEMEYLDLKQP
ncbi:MAG: aldo/keto reductase [Actinomycetota bacterium]|nr:aldo/keto reductase [Actinomycetota bacterium]